MPFTTTQHQAGEFDYDSLRRTFDALPRDQYVTSTTRYRALSTFEVAGGDRLILRPQGNLYQSRRDHQDSETDGVPRQYAPIPDSTQEIPAFKQMLYAFADQAAHFTDGSIDVHQIRIAASGSELAAVAPEGPHRDAVRFVGIMGIRRQNVRGGDMMLINPESREIEYQKQLIPGLWVVFDDADYLHYGSPIHVVLNSLGRALLDFFVLTTPSLVRYDLGQGQG